MSTTRTGRAGTQRIVVEHGLADIVGHVAPLDRVTMVLETTYAEFDRADPKPAASWAEHLGRRMSEELAA